MDAILNNCNLVLTLPNDTILINKKDAYKALQLSKESTNHCLLVFSEKDKKCITSIYYIGEAQTKEEYDDIIQIFAEQNDSIGIRLIDKKNISSPDGRSLNILKFTNRRNRIVVIFSRMNNKIIMANTNSNQENFEEAIKFTTEIMKTLAPVE